MTFSRDAHFVILLASTTFNWFKVAEAFQFKVAEAEAPNGTLMNRHLGGTMWDEVKWVKIAAQCNKTLLKHINSSKDKSSSQPSKQNAVLHLHLNLSNLLV